MFPDAPVFALLYSDKLAPASLAKRVVVSPLQKVPGAVRKHRLFLPLYPAAIESFDLSPYDVILSSHHTVAKGLLRNADQYHLCYCHTPMRALWERPAAELKELPGVLRPLGQQIFGQLRLWDLAATSRVDRFIANSETTRRRIAKHYQRESSVLNPPIDVEHFTPGPTQEPEDYYLVVSRLVPYKRVDLAVAATGSADRKLIVVGAGPNHKSMRGARHVEYRGHVSDAELLTLMRNARALIFPALEDFGMAPIEMMACGRPVIAYRAGGLSETIIDGVTGVFADHQTEQSFAEALHRFEGTGFDRFRIRNHAEGFSKKRFVSALHGFVNTAFSELQESLLRTSAKL